MPRPSKGCRTCRRRKIKCDQARPICDTCRRTGRQCLGYDIEPSGFVFRSGNIIDSLNRPHQAVSESAFDTYPIVSEQEYWLAFATSSVYKGQDPATNHVLASLDDSLQDRALAYYWTYYLVDASSHPSDTIRSYTQLILSKSPGVTEPILSYAIAAESLLVFGKKHGVTRSIDLARESYYCALKETMSSVQNIERACSDQFLLAIMIFSGYEFKNDSACDPRSRALTAEGFKHHVGAMSILKLRKEMRARNTMPIDIRIDRMVRQQILRSCILRAYPLPEILSDGASFGEVDETLELDQCYVEIARLRALSHQLLSPKQTEDDTNTTERQKALGLLKLAVQIDMRLEAFTNCLRATWPYFKVLGDGNNSDLQDNDLVLADTIHIYPTHMSSHLWNSYRSARMICNSFITMLSRRASLSAHPDLISNVAYARTRLSNLIDTVCESVSFYLLDPLIVLSLADNYSELEISLNPGNEVCRAYRLTFVLVVALMTDGLDDVRRCWIRDKIRRISNITTSGTLLMLAS